MVMKPGMGRKASAKNPPILSHEFILQNHADIVSCIAMLFLIGLMVQATSPIASLFITLHHNVSGADPSKENPQGEAYSYEAGWKDACAVFFYSLVCIVMHAIVQEYFLDKISKRFHLSKSRLNSLNESGQLIIFYLMSVLWGCDAILREGFLFNFTLLWDGYPNHPMSFLLKLWWVVQASYWFHAIPELYFQRIKREDWSPRIQQAVAGFSLTLAAYAFSFQRVGVCLVVLHGIGELFVHLTKLDGIIRADREDKVARLLRYGNMIVFVSVRLCTMVVAVLTFWYGLAQEGAVQPAIRFGALLTVGALQIYLMYNFITQQIAVVKEMRAQEIALLTKVKPVKKDKIKKDKGKRSSVEESDLPEVDQNTNKNLRARSTNQTKTK
ncbi:translocating chain-associated membrane protein 1 [Arctopsyche grandis]|uniref:translocating chain-associated membrane protein 1 n=1 Tax=Arctopsyche grandis TaxID=121162 RepID=UPI00406D7D6C